MRVEPAWAETNRIMLGAGFDARLMRLSRIWAAKHQKCEACGAAPFTPCRNLAAIKAVGFKQAGKNWHPHAIRIDYDRLKQALIDRGYTK